MQDYVGHDVNAVNFLAVLAGDAVSSRFACTCWASLRQARAAAAAAHVLRCTERPLRGRPPDLCAPLPPQSKLVITGRSSGKVIKAGPSDRVFVFFRCRPCPTPLCCPGCYAALDCCCRSAARARTPACVPMLPSLAAPRSDHGAPGILGMPSGPFLYADQLRAVLEARASNNGFKEMVL